MTQVGSTLVMNVAVRKALSGVGLTSFLAFRATVGTSKVEIPK
jgi:hypothetical protein